MSFRSFPLIEPTDAGPVVELGSVRVRCIPRLPVQTLATFGEERRFSYAAALVNFLRSVAVVDDLSDLDGVLISRTNPADLEYLDAVVGWVISEYSDRPSLPSSASSPGGTPTPGGSTDGSPSMASTSPASIPAAP